MSGGGAAAAGETNPVQAKPLQNADNAKTNQPVRTQRMRLLYQECKRALKRLLQHVTSHSPARELCPLRVDACSVAVRTLRECTTRSSLEEVVLVAFDAKMSKLLTAALSGN
ncbi:MAG: hypothetical protein RL701_2893 [Pseudomonadota bacterium]